MRKFNRNSQKRLECVGAVNSSYSCEHHNRVQLEVCQVQMLWFHLGSNLKLGSQPTPNLHPSCKYLPVV